MNKGKESGGENIVSLKTRIKELEGQVSDYKKRLDELRKAKNTTVVKRERELLEVNAPSLGKRDMNSTRVRELENLLKENEARSKQAILDLQKKFADDLSAARSAASNSKDNEDELNRLRRRISELEGENAVYQMENASLSERVEGLLTELSIKEAEWCENEEKLNLKLKMGWGEKYKEWMEQTEKKLEELQHTNQLLREYIKRQKPKGSDPSGQDPDLPF